MNKSKIEWCDYTWNPVTGCLHGCPYCYARGIAKRFGISELDDGKTHTREEIYSFGYAAFHETMSNPYPFGFSPTLHLTEKWGFQKAPVSVKKPQNIFVCSMADLFGDWVPNEWIHEVFKACEAAPQHRYLFLTKNPVRYFSYYGIGESFDCAPDNWWFGASAEMVNKTHCTTDALAKIKANTFLSLEPLQENVAECIYHSDVDWVIIGAETGNRKDKVVPKREWIENIVDACQDANVPVFMKNSLADIWGEPLIQEYPWE